MKTEKAFSLIELLVVMAVIGLLMSLIVPGLAQVKQSGRKTGCLGNLKQWGLATHLFASDNDDYLPKDGAPNGTSITEGWYVDLPKTLGIPIYHEEPWRTNASLPLPPSLWICPANKRRSNGANLFHYCLNEHVNDTGAGNQVRLGTLSQPAETVWLFDNGGLAAVAQQNNIHTNVHGAGAQILYLDGHVRYWNARAYWDFDRNRGKTNNGDIRWFP